VNCPSCGRDLPERARFCSRCGTAVASAVGTGVAGAAGLRAGAGGEAPPTDEFVSAPTRMLDLSEAPPNVPPPVSPSAEGSLASLGSAPTRVVDLAAGPAGNGFSEVAGSATVIAAEPPPLRRPPPLSCLRRHPRRSRRSAARGHEPQRHTPAPLPRQPLLSPRPSVPRAESRTRPASRFANRVALRWPRRCPVARAAAPVAA